MRSLEALAQPACTYNGRPASSHCRGYGRPGTAPVWPLRETGEAMGEAATIHQADPTTVR